MWFKRFLGLLKRFHIDDSNVPMVCGLKISIWEFKRFSGRFKRFHVCFKRFYMAGLNVSIWLD